MLKIIFISLNIKHRHVFFLILLISVWVLYSNKQTLKHSNVQDILQVLSSTDRPDFVNIETCPNNLKNLRGQLTHEKIPINFGAFFDNMTKDDFIFLKNIENGKN